MNLTFQAWSCVYNGPPVIFIVENLWLADFASVGSAPPALFLPVHSSTDAHLFSHLKLGSVRKWGGHRKYSSVSLFYVNICIYMDISDKEWLLSLVSYLELVDYMDRKCHEIVYMKSWPNMDSKLWTCSTHSLGTPIHAHATCWNLLKPAWPCANPACANADACMPPQKFSDYSWVFVPFVISRGLHRGSLPKRDKLLENTQTVGRIFWGSCSPDCRSTDPNNAGSCDRLGWKTEGLSGLLPLVFLGLRLAVKTSEEDPVQHPALSLVWPSWKEICNHENPEGQELFF